MRLNGWQRIGIVLSILWAIGAAIYERQTQIDSGTYIATRGFAICIEPASADHDKCYSKLSDDLSRSIEPHWGNVAFYALAPVLAGWLVAYVLLWVVRWVRRGFDTRRGD